MRAELNTARQVFEEALAAFAQRTRLVGTERYDDLRAQEHYRAFAVAGAMKADLLADLHEAVRKAVVDGGTIQEFRKDFWRTVETRGWRGWTGEGTRHGEAWRTRVIYRTNTRKAYSTGRYAQLTDPQMLAVRPYWKWVHSGTAHDPRPEHLGWSGMTLHHTDPFWQTHWPPRIPPDYGCGCRVVAVRAPASGAQTTAPAGWESDADPGAGAPPADVVEDIRAFIRQKQARLPPALARDLGEVVDSYQIGSRGPLRAASIVAARRPAAPAVQPVAPDAFDRAVAGGEHAGLLRRYRDDGTIQLMKAIRSYDARIREHESWVADPSIKLGPDYPSERAEHLRRKWGKDIARLRDERAIMAGILRERMTGGKND